MTVRIFRNGPLLLGTLGAIPLVAAACAMLVCHSEEA
jgi:hypothetical protein